MRDNEEYSHLTIDDLISVYGHRDVVKAVASWLSSTNGIVTIAEAREMVKRNGGYVASNALLKVVQTRARVRFNLHMREAIRQLPEK